MLDSESPDPRLAEDEFRFLKILNATTDAANALVATIDARLAPAAGDTVTLVEHGCGAGDIVATAVGRAKSRGWRLDALVTDRSEIAIAAARAHLARAGLDGVRFERRDLLAPPPEPEKARVAHASLVLHHFADEDVVRALQTMAASATDLVVWNDLLRDKLGEFGAWVSTIGRSAVLRHDAILSVRRGFTKDDARAFAEAAGLADIEVVRWRGARFVLSARPGRQASGALAQRPRIRASGLRFAFGANTVLDGRSIVLRAGEVGLLEGPNGSGKTTTLRILAGALTPDEGSAWCDTTDGPVGYLPQRGGLVSTLSIAGNLRLMQRIARCERSTCESRARDALSRMGLEALAGRTIERLSIGQSRRAAIASVLACAGGVLLLDEPDAGLDADGRERLAAAIIDRAREGGTALVASHEPAWLERACAAQGIALVRGGRP